MVPRIILIVVGVFVLVYHNDFCLDHHSRSKDSSWWILARPRQQDEGPIVASYGLTTPVGGKDLS